MMGYNRHMTECDIWEASLRQGYGQIWLGGTMVSTHRLVWMQDHGHTDLFILHSCDTPACINIDHLRAGTAAENTRDMIERGRHVANGMEKRTHCKQGHEFDEANTFVTNQGCRGCRTCQRRFLREHRARQNAMAT